MPTLKKLKEDKISVTSKLLKKDEDFLPISPEFIKDLKDKILLENSALKLSISDYELMCRKDKVLNMMAIALNKPKAKLKKFCKHITVFKENISKSPKSIANKINGINGPITNLPKEIRSTILDKFAEILPSKYVLLDWIDKDKLDWDCLSENSNAIDLLKENPNKGVWGDNLHTFSVGLKGSPDLKYAKDVADFLGTVHHEFTFTIQEGIDALRDVIYHLETYDVTTIRASTPMYLMSRKIKATGIKMVLSGEGADEILGGYLYFHNAPTEEEFHKEVIKRVSGLHYFDCLRANKSTMAWGLEVRVPFLDKQFLETAIPIRRDYKMNKITENGKNIEKYILRKAFSKELNDGYKYLPDSVLWRQKEQFSDGVGYSWVDTLIEKTEDKYTDDEFTNLIQKYPYNTPKTKEALFYREIFEELFPKCEKTVEKWIPNTQWEGVKSDPSGRAQGVHSECDNNMV